MRPHNRTVPAISLEEFYAGALSPEGRRALVQKIGDAFVKIGFVVIVGHPIDHKLIMLAYDEVRRLFHLDQETLRRYEIPSIDRQRGYSSFGVEGAKDQTLGDLKHSWFVGRECPEGHPYRKLDGYYENIWPEEVPEMRQVMPALYRQLEGIGLDLLSLIEEYLGLPRKNLTGMAENGHSLLRLLHYPAMPTGFVTAGSIRSAAHEDINLITLLVGALGGGQGDLQVKTRDGEWIPVDEEPNCIVVNVADMLQEYTKGRLVSTTHRVVNGTHLNDRERLSMPFFLHPRAEVVLNEKTGLTAGDFLAERLRAIGVAEQGDKKN